MKNKNNLLLRSRVFMFAFALCCLASLNSLAQTTCNSQGQSIFGRRVWIERFEMSTINNLSGNNNGYADYTSQSASVTPGQTVPFTIETDNNLFFSFFNARIWFDLNNNGDFNDAGELVYSGSGNGAVNGSIQIPANTIASSFTARVQVRRFGTPVSCGNYFLGETEDYSVNVNSACDADAGSLQALNSSECIKAGSAELSATVATQPVVPPGYSALYVLTQGPGLIIQQVNTAPFFVVNAGGTYTIHTLVYNPATLDLSIVVPGVTTGFDVNALLIQGGGSICAALDVAGAAFTVNQPEAGTMTAVVSGFCFDGSAVTISATTGGNAVIPPGYQQLFVLTQGPNLVIQQVNATPSFTVSAPGLYTIHSLVYDPATLDLSIVVPGTTTGFDVNNLLVQGGGTICASLDVAGAPVNISNPDAGTLTAVNSQICSSNAGATLTANPSGTAVVPANYQVIYVLTSGAGLVIEQVNGAPSFNVTSGGLYTIHTLVYNPATLDLSIVVPGVTTGFDVNGLLVQGGGNICAALDVAGATFNVEAPSAGTLSASNNTVCLNNGTAQLSATPDGNAVVPSGYQTIYVLTSGSGLTIEQVNATPDFNVTSGGLFTIHTLVYNPLTLDLSIVVPGVTTGFDVNGLLVQGGGTICGALDVSGAPFNVDAPFAGTLTPKVASFCSNGNASVLEALASGTAVVPSGYSTIYVLTSGSGLVIEQVNSTPVFTVTGSGLYTIHTLVYNPATLDLSIVVPGVTTGFDVNGLLVQGGGSICASLDVAGAQFTIANPFAGTLTATSSSNCFVSGSVNISASPNGDAIVPAGYQTLYVLTSGPGLVIEQVSTSPSFTVTNSGNYTIHTLVYDPATLDLTIVVPGVTTGFDVNGLLVQGGGSICASLDVAGAQVAVNNPAAGALIPVNVAPCSSIIAATPDGNAFVPAGYQILYVLTSGTGLVIEQVSPTPNFVVPGDGIYTIHTLVYDATTLDLSIVVPGVTTGFDVNSLLVQGGGSICAALDVAGAQFNIANPNAGTLNAPSTYACFNGGTAQITATPNGDALVPAGYQTLYVLTSGLGLVIEQVNTTPDFTVSAQGLYTIHTLVYDPATLDLSIVVPGVTTGFDVNGLLVQGGGSICASLDVAGAPVNVGNPSAGNLSNNGLFRCLNNGTAVLNATPAGNAVVPAGFSVIYVLTKGQGLVIQQVNTTPDFTVSQIGIYRIHTLVYDPATLNLGIVVPGVTTGFNVNALLVQGGGSICGSLDVQGAPYFVLGPVICSFFNLDNVVAENLSEETIQTIKTIAESGSDNSSLNLSVFPNPVSDLLNVNFNMPVAGASKIEVFNYTGQLLIEKSLNATADLQQVKVDVSTLPSGNYFVRIVTPSGTEVKKFGVK